MSNRDTLFYDWPGEDHLGFWKRERIKSFVYVIQADPKGPIKIGVAKDVRKRRSSLQCGNAEPLRILLVAPGSYTLETQLHRMLVGSEVSGEWFGGPAVPGFLEWMEQYCYETVEACRKTAYVRTKLPAVEEKKTRSVGLHSVGGYFKPSLQHRWRVKPDAPAPMEVRFVEPNPKMSAEEAEEIRSLHRGDERPLSPLKPTNHPASLSQS